MGRIISGRYEEVEQLGQGGQGVVYKVRHIEHKTDLALKVLPSYLEDEEMMARFEQEAQMMTRLRHRNIARVLGSGRDEVLKLHFIVMEYIQGKNLKQHLREKGPLPLPEVLEIARQIAGALSYAHSQPSAIIHRDIKPTNLMLEDSSERVVVLDFGIAKEIGEPERSQTQTGVMLGTWKYCAPEQLRHESLSGSADVYSLGMVMYEMYTGTPFFSGLDEQAVLGKVLYDQREHAPYFARPTLPAFVTLVTKAIAKSQDKRYRRMADLLNDLEACWWALDDTRTIILSPQSSSARPLDAPQGEIAELDEQIRRLEEERQRHTLTTIQGQVRIAKEQAERGGARQWASALFEQGLACEMEGEAHSRERQYAQAQEAYEVAIARFTQAGEEASKGAAAQQVEKERQDTYTAKADAERVGAQEQANAAYARALTLVAQADQFREQQLFPQAEPLYRDARQLFEDARDLAYREMQQREAEAARAQTQMIRAAALADGGVAFAAIFFAEGQANEQQATTALEHEDFTQARRFYLAAQQKYENAQRQAKRAQQRRQEVLALAAQTQAMQQQAIAASKNVQSQESYSQAEELVRQAMTLLDAQEYTRAGQIYTQARDLYEAALRAVERELQQERVQTAREAVIAARKRAEAVEAERWFPDAWVDGQKEEDAGNALVTQEQWDDALRQYQQAQQRWEALSVTALQRREQTQAEYARQVMRKEKELSSGLTDWATSAWEEAERHETQAEHAYQQQRFTQAAEWYGQAEQAYIRARQQAEEQQQEAERRAVIVMKVQQLERLQQAVQSARTMAENAGAQEKDSVDYSRAVTRQAEADQLFIQQDYQHAHVLFDEAQTLFAQVLEQAQQRAVVMARAVQVTHDRVSAMATDLESLSAYQEARATHQQATAFFTATQYAQAEAAYQQAHKQYERAAQAVEQRVTSAQERMRAAQEAAVQEGAAQFCAEEWTEVMQSATTAQQHVDRGETAQAMAAFQQTEERFTQLRSIAAQRKAQDEERQHHLALAAQLAAEEGRAAAENVEAPQYASALYRQANQLMSDVQQHLQAARWQEALPLLTQAQELFTKASAEAPREKAQQTADVARGKAMAGQQEAQKGRGPVYFPERFAQATTLLAKAEDAFRRGNFPLAQRGFEEGALLLQQIHHTAAVREKAEEELAALSISDFPSSEQEVPPQPPTAFPKPVQAEQREVPRPVALDRLTNGQIQEEPPQEATHALPPPRRATEPSRASSPPQTIPPTALLSGKTLMTGVVFLLLIFSGYLFLPRSADEPKSIATAPATSPASASKILPQDEKKPKTEAQAQSLSSLSPPPLTKSEKAGRLSHSSSSSVEEPHGQGKTEEPQVAKILPLPPAQPPLTLLAVEPSPGDELTVKEGEVVNFSVTVDDAGSRSLQYRWTLNGVQQSTEATWGYKPKFDEAEETPKTVHVVVRDATSQTVERDWRVRVIAVNRSPTITASTPRLGTTVQMAAGATRKFSVSATDPDKEGPLTYRWLLDGDAVGEAQEGNWQFRAPTSDGTHQLTVEIQDSGGEKIRQSWDVVVKTLGPSLRWVRFQPKNEQVRTQTGQPVEFTAFAELLSGTSGARGIQYQWRVNDTLLQTEETGRFRFTENRAGLYQVSVVALNTEGIKSPLRKWAIDVRPLEPPPSVRPSEEGTPEPRSIGRCDNDVRNWLESYRRAWETKNVRTLAALGIISRWDMDRVAENLKQSQVFRVTLTDVEIQCEGEQATVSFKRVDTLDGTTFAHPEQTVIHLEKRNGRMAIRGR
jgi:predicted Ser/Thr protein kinase